jgi:hypothetical protein
MEMHRAATVCRSCHMFMDPIGLALDNFDVTGKWRIRENGAPLDTRGSSTTGLPLAAPADLRAALLKRPEPLVRTFTENLMAYALGRRVEVYDKPTVRPHRAPGGGGRLSPLVVHSRSGEERRVPDEADTGRRHRRPPPLRRDKEPHMDVISGRHLPRRTFLRGVGATWRLPLPRRDGPAGRLGRGRAAAGLDRSASDRDRDGARHRRLQRLGREPDTCGRPRRSAAASI